MFFKRATRDKTDSSASEEATLLQRARGDVTAFAPLYERYAPRIYSYCLRRVSQPEEAEDLTSLVFTRALANLSSYRGGSVAAWLFQIAHNAVANHLRGRRPQVSLEIAVMSGWTDHLVEEPGQTVLEGLIRLEQKEQLAVLIAALPAEQREVLALSIAGGLTAKEVGQVLGKSEAAVWMMLHRLTQRLRTEYQRQFAAEED